MLLMGDEMRRTQFGNNNAYCQDNETSWLDWTALERHRDLHRFVKELLRLRLKRDVVSDGDGATLGEVLTLAGVEWHGVGLGAPDWSPASHTLAFTLHSVRGRRQWHVIINAFWEPLSFQLPAAPDVTNGSWRRCLDTSLGAPQDVVSWTDAAPIADAHYMAAPRSVVMLARALDPGWSVRAAEERPE
jgi:glycogen operon protein